MVKLICIRLYNKNVKLLFKKITNEKVVDAKAVVDYTSQLKPGAACDVMNDKYAVAENNVVTISFSGWAKSNAGGDMVIATIPTALRPNINNLFFTAFDHTLKTALGCRISGTNIIVNNLKAGNAFWIAVTYVKK